MLRERNPSRVVQAPSRGGYDRARTRAERHAEQRDRLLQAAAEMYDGRLVTVSRIIAHAGVSRNTFYEHFDDAEHALGCVTQRALELLSSAATAAANASRTPFEQLRSLAREWISVIMSHPHIVELGLRTDDPLQSLSPVGRQFISSLRDVIAQAKSDSLVVESPSAAALVAAAGSAEVLAKACIVGELGTDAASRALFDVLARTLH